MASIIINSACNLKCPFCFATETRDAEEEKKSNMGKEEFSRYLDFDNNIVTSLCGGEPTLHPEFITYMDMMFARRGKFINLLTNGLWPSKVYEYIKNLEFNKSKRIMYLFNILNPKLYTEKQLEMLGRSLSCINPETAFIGFTVYKKDFDYSYIFDFAEKYNIKRIRYSIAAPNVTDENSWNISPEQDFKELASLIYDFVTEAVDKGYEVNSDCGYLPPCVYTKEQLAELMLIQPGIKFKCASVGDIGKGGKVWRCYGLYSAVNGKIEEFKNIQEMQTIFSKESEVLLGTDVLDECEDCEYKKLEICNGGCLVYRVIKNMKKNLDITANYLRDDDKFIHLVPTLNEKVLKIWNKAEDETYTYIRKKQKMQVKLLENKKEMLDIIQTINGEKSIREIIEELTETYENEALARQNIIGITKELFINDCLKLR